MKKILFVTMTILSISACTPQIEELRDDDFELGCVGVIERATVGYLGQGIGADICKFKCSKTLPENYVFEWDDQRSGCSGKIIPQSSDNPSPQITYRATK